VSRTVTLSQLRTDVLVQADLVGATVRHDSTILNRLINQSIQGFREAISNEGNQHYLVSSSGTLTAGATSPHSFLSLDLSAISPSIVRTFGFDVTVDGVVHTLDHRPFTERNIWGGPTTTGIPRNWAHYQTAKLAIQPAPNAAYPYTIWYLPVLADLSADGDTFDGVSGWEEWIVWDVVCKLLIRDQQGQAFGSAKLYRDDTWTRIHKQATRVSSAGGAVVGRDSIRGRIPDFLAARGPSAAGGSPPAVNSIALDMLVQQTGPIFLGVIAGTTNIQTIGMGTGAAMLPLFTPTARGMVPAAGGSGTDKFLRQDGTFAVPPGSGGGSVTPPGGASGAIQFHGISGFAGYDGFAVQGAPPSMTVRLPGTLRVTGGSVEVGSGTVRISASGIDLGGGALRNVASLFAFPTFAAGVPGLVPSSGNDTNNYLRADGVFAIPPGGSATVPSGANRTLQFNNNGSFDGVTGIAVSPSGQGFQFGNAPAATGIFALSHGMGVIYGRSSDNTQDLQILKWAIGGIGNDTIGIGGSGIAAVKARAQTQHSWELEALGGSSQVLSLQGGRAKLQVSGRVDADALVVASGISNANLHPMGSGTVKANFGPTGTAPADVPIATLAAWLPTFTATIPGIVPPSGGGVDNFLRADGVFGAPSGAHQFPPAAGATNEQLAAVPSGTVKARLSAGIPQDIIIPTLAAFFPTFTANRAGLVMPGDGDTSKFLNAAGAFATPAGGSASGPLNPGGSFRDLQYNTGAGFGGASGITVAPSGAALVFGPPLLAANYGDIRGASGFSINVRNPSGIQQPMLDWFSASGIQRLGGSGLPKLIHGVASGGTMDFSFGGVTGTTLQLLPTGIHAPDFHIRAKSIDVAHINGLPADANQLKRGLNIGDIASGMPSGIRLYSPRGSASGSNRYIIPSGVVGTGIPKIVLYPTGARGGEVIRIERLAVGGYPVEVTTPTGTVLWSFPSGTKSTADFVFTKPSGTAFEHGGSGDLH
jgi:hypothetical protein